MVQAAQRFLREIQPGPLIQWCHSHLVWFFPLQLIQPRNSLTDTSKGWFPW